jgi:hypothetical protein
MLTIYMLFLPEGQTGEVWKPSKRQCCFGNLGASDRNVRTVCILLSHGLRFNLNVLRCFTFAVLLRYVICTNIHSYSLCKQGDTRASLILVTKRVSLSLLNVI